MTANQIAFSKLRNERDIALRSQEIEKHKATSARLSAEAAQHQAETARIRSGTEKATLGETSTHNRAMEDIQRSTLAVESSKLDELRRHNKASESLQESSIGSQYAVGMARAAAADKSALAQVMQANVSALRQSEDARHNLEAEKLKLQENEMRSYEGITGRLNYDETKKKTQSEVFRNYASPIAGVVGSLAKSIMGGLS